MSPAQQQTAAAADAMFGKAGGTPVWAQETVHAPGANDAGRVAAAYPAADSPPIGGPVLARRGWSASQIAMWMVIGAIVIGGGIFAGLQLRSMRLQRQIAEKKDRAGTVAKADTWTAWTAARDNFAQIVSADGSVVNRAALARVRALVAYEFSDGLAEAKAAVDDLAGQGGLDGSIAAAYVALAQGDPKAAKVAADAAVSASRQDPAALYVAGRAALAGGDTKAATTSLREAYQRDARPLYGVGLAQALAAENAWDEAVTTVDRVLAASPDHPTAMIARARMLADCGRVTPNDKAGLDLHTQVEKLVAEGGKPPAEQPHGVSPGQVAFADLALARVDYARGDVTTARGDLRAAASVGIDDLRFAEEATETLLAIGDLAHARDAAEQALKQWPQSRRTRIALAQVQLATGKPGDALATLEKADVLALPVALAVRGQARLATGDAAGARQDFDAALKKAPNLEPALVGSAWLALGDGRRDDARKLIEPRVAGGAPTPALATIYAAVLRDSGDAAARAKAKAMLERVVAGPPGLEVSRAELELARLDRDLGDFRGARAAYAEAIKAGNFDARLESGLVLIEDHDPIGGHETLETLLREQGDHAPPNLALEVARARMLVGDNAGAQTLLDAAAKAATTTKWKLDRERGRLALRKGDFAGAVAALTRALDGCGGDAETLLLAADAATSDDKDAPGLAAKIKKLTGERLQDQPEASIVTGKLMIADKKYSEAVAVFQAAQQALVKANASRRRQAQAHFGLAVAKYNTSDDAEADTELQLVIEKDPSLYTAYLYRAFLAQDKQARSAFDLATRAVELDPDSTDGWLLVGQLASKLGNKKAFTDAFARLSAIAPTSDAYRQLAKLRR
jgi:tetratricopeptide (TPR) repeat protein